MNYVEIVVKVIKDKGYTITQNPCKARLKKECGKQVFFGSYLEFEHKPFLGIRKSKIFVSNREDTRNFHDGNILLKGKHLPSIIWFKGDYDEIIINKGLLI